jgi:hypothetical protein
MNYNPEEKVESTGGGKAEPGRYRFKVDSAIEKTFRSGNEGLETVLLAGAFETRDVKVFARFAYTPKALWKLEQFMQSIGLDFQDKSLQPADFFGRTGEADFILDEKGYLEVENFIPASANNGAMKRPQMQPAGTFKTQTQPPMAASEDVPF